MKTADGPFRLPPAWWKGETTVISLVVLLAMVIASRSSPAPRGLPSTTGSTA